MFKQFKSITVEPVIFLFTFAMGINFPALNALLYKKVKIMSRFNMSIFLSDKRLDKDEVNRWRRRTELNMI